MEKFNRFARVLGSILWPVWKDSHSWQRSAFFESSVVSRHRSGCVRCLAARRDAVAIYRCAGFCVFDSVW